MSVRHIFGTDRAGLLAAMLAVACQGTPAVGRLLSTPRPIDGAILFLPQAERDRRFAHMERFYAGHVVRASTTVRHLAHGAPLALLHPTLDAYMEKANVAGVIVLQDGHVRLERYARGRGPRDRWTSFSVAKSVTSTLVGAAIRDGYIRSVRDPVTRYLPQLTGSGYDGVTIAQLLTMTSGVRWNEDYADPASDVAKLYGYTPPDGSDRTLSYMRRLARAAPPGTRWSYNTGETDLAGLLVQAATHRSLADYLSRAVWRRCAMASDAYWLTDAAGHEAGGSGLSMTLPDAARLGQLALDGDRGVVPEGWFEVAARAQVHLDTEGDGYGYLWWTYSGGRFAARGIFGQSILVDPAHRVVIAMAADWPHATDADLSAARARLEQQVIDATER